MCKDGRKKSPNISLIITVRCANANAHVCCRFELRDKERDDVGDEVMLWVIVLRHLGGRFVGLFLLRRQRRDVYCLYLLLALNYRSVQNKREHTVGTPSYLIVVSSEKTDTGYTLPPSRDRVHLPSQHPTFVVGCTLIIRIISFQRDSQ
jgi:hypothetical protein